MGSPKPTIGPPSERRGESGPRQRDGELGPAREPEAAQEPIRRLSRALAHGINNYVGAITGQCELVKMKLPQGDRVAVKMDLVIATAAKLSAMVRQLALLEQPALEGMDAALLEQVIASLQHGGGGPAPTRDGGGRSSALLRGDETLLLVEDTDDLRTAMREVLSALGYSVLVARDGLEALELLRCRRGRVDLVVSDVSMPRMNGPEVFARVRARWPEVRFLFVSAQEDRSRWEPDLRDAASDFLAKPVPAMRLAHKVRELLDRDPIVADG